MFKFGMSVKCLVLLVIKIKLLARAILAISKSKSSLGKPCCLKLTFKSLKISEHFYQKKS
jgi:hypothetical protein